MVTFVKEFENFILSENEDDLRTLILGSDSELYITLVKLIKQISQRGKVGEELKSAISKAMTRFPINVYLTAQAITLLKEFDLQETSDNRRKEIINEIQRLHFPNLKFDYPKPSNVRNVQTASEQTNISSQLDDSKFSTKIELDDYLKNPNDIDKLNKIHPDLFFSEVDLAQLPEEFFRQLLIEKRFSLPLHLIPNEKLATLANFINKFAENQKYFPYIDDSLRLMTIEQLQNLSELITTSYFDKSDFQTLIINKKYKSKLSEASSDKELINIYQEIYSNTPEGPKFKPFRVNMLFEILSLGVKLNLYNLDLFIEYLKNPMNTHSNYFQQNKKREAYKRYIIGEQPSSLSESSLVTSYLYYFFFFEKIKYDYFDEYLSKEVVSKTYYRVQVLLGEDGNDNDRLIKALGRGEYESLVKSQEITICKHNREKFSVDENVSLLVDLKNISTLFIKIFEINTENYYYNKKSPINTAINLEGLIPSYEETFSYSEKPQKIVRREFVFDKIPLRRGLFVIEFIGGGLSSRAVIKKGSLNMVTRSTHLGKMLFILDENNQICKGEKTGVWFNNKFYKGDLKSGVITIPFMRSVVKEAVILLHENFSELGNLTVDEESYSLQGSFIFNHESLMMGNTAKVIFRPFLFINGRESKVEYLQNARIRVNTTKKDGGSYIPVTFNIDNVKITKENDFVFDIQIPPKLVKIEFTFEAEVKNHSKEKMDSLKVTKSLGMDSSMDDRSLVRFFLRKVGDESSHEYILTLLGKNGEAKPNFTLDFDFHLRKMTKIVKTTLVTDQNGACRLNTLNNVKGFSVKTNSNNNNEVVSANFDISNKRLICYPESIDILEGESITLPFDSVNTDDMKQVHLIKTDVKDDQILERITSGFGLIKEGSRYVIKAEKLAQGKYILTLGAGYESSFESNRSISITVHGGKIWETENFIIKKTEIIENSENKYPVYIKQVNMSGPSGNSLNNSENLFNLKIDIANFTKNTRLHIFSSNYLNRETFGNTYSLIDIYRTGQKQSKHSFQNWKNFYLSNRSLNEEIQYVFDRKYYERFMGNSLEKPSLVVKRLFIRDTNWEDEVINQGEEFEKMEADVMEEKTVRYKAQSMQSYQAASGKYPKLNTVSYSDFQNFLKHSPLIMTNLHPNENGEISLENLSLHNYSHLTFILVDEKNFYEELFSLNKISGIEKRDLTLSKNLDVDKTFAEVRKTQLVLKNEEVKISDITSVNFQILDSLEKFVNYILLINPKLKDEWKKFNFLLNLESSNDIEIRKNISKYFSHELNLFIYFKHPILFEKYIRPALKFKLEKTFVDYFLLGDKESINKFANSANKKNMNPFEICLLIYYLKSEPDKKQMASYLADSMRSSAEEIKISPEERKRLFNIMMNMRTEDGDSTKNTKILLDLAPTQFSANEMNRPRNVQLSEANINQISDLGYGGFAFQSNFNCQSRPQKEELCDYMMEEEDGVPQCDRRKEDVFGECERDQMSNYSKEIYEKNTRNNLLKSSGVTKEYVEKQYYYSADFSLKMFWADLADHLLQNSQSNNYDSAIIKGFLSANIFNVADSLTSLIISLSVLDLPAHSSPHKFDRSEGLSLKITPSSNFILFTKEITNAEAEYNSNLMIAQNVTDYLDQNSDTVIKEYLVNKVYSHETIITNISNSDLDYELLVQIPQGALPVLDSEYTRTYEGRIAKFNTLNYRSYFYFPKVGLYQQYPPSAAIAGVIKSRGSPMTYSVHKEDQVQLSKENFEDVLTSGSKDDILQFIQSKFIDSRGESLSKERINQSLVTSIDDLIAKTYWLLKENDFYKSLLKLLREKSYFNKVVWSFAFYHKDYDTLKEYLENEANFMTYIGPYFTSKLLTVNDKNNHNILNHLDYSPVFNARVHKLGRENDAGILNKEFKETYEKFIITFLLIENPPSKLWLRLCYYLILQDRCEEALKVFGKINTTEFNSDSSLMLQYDYIAAYLDFTYGYPEFKVAKENCERYKNFPLSHWRELFEEIEDELIEYEGRELVPDVEVLLDEEAKKKKMKKIAQSEDVNLTFTIENKTLQITHSKTPQNLVIKFYLIDIEVLFSRSPFIKSNSDDFSYVQANFVHVLKTSSGSLNSNYEIPLEYTTKNLFIEVSSDNRKTFDTYFSTSLKVSVSENLGEVKVADSQSKPINKVYVKCFAKMKDTGAVSFYKDGYTDLRGRFNYLALNSDRLKQIEKFAVLVLHDQLGSVIKEASLPANVANQTDNNNYYENLQNYRQECRQVWRSYNKKK